jgi:hypothetical protein
MAERDQVCETAVVADNSWYMETRLMAEYYQCSDDKATVELRQLERDSRWGLVSRRRSE